MTMPPTATMKINRDRDAYAKNFKLTGWKADIQSNMQTIQFTG